MLNYTVSTSLCKIMEKYGSDKGSSSILESWHNYTVFYYDIFKNRQLDELRIFELGLGTNDTTVPSNMGKNGKPGASLRAWEEFFPNAYVFGADIDSKCLFETPRIKTYYCDQLNNYVIKYMWNEKELQYPMDLIIDDGLHTFEANVCFFENSIHKLANGGIYVIEDILNSNIHRFETKIKEWKTVYPSMQFELLRIPSLVNRVDNNILIIRKPTEEQCASLLVPDSTT